VQAVVESQTKDAVGGAQQIVIPSAYGRLVDFRTVPRWILSTYEVFGLWLSTGYFMSGGWWTLGTGIVDVCSIIRPRGRGTETKTAAMLAGTIAPLTVERGADPFILNHDIQIHSLSGSIKISLRLAIEHCPKTCDDQPLVR